MKKSQSGGKITALYERLSRDDEQKNESISIAHQKQMLEAYAQKNGFHNIRHFTDDGITGTVFNRPGLNAMVEEVKAGNVATVIIKDQSRIGRDVLEVGLLKRTFEENNVRFIAAEDGLDTANGFDIMSIFRDVINEFYVADTSRKIKAVFKSRMEKGQSCSGSISYGYLADPQDKQKWIIDEEAAAVVRRIFQMIIEGKGVSEIGRTLRAEQIPIPSEHWKRIGAPVRCAGYADPYAWSATTISYIIGKPEYMGQRVLGKTVCENYKTGYNRKTTPEERFYFEGAIPAIVDEETWNNAQRLKKTVRRPPKREGPPNPLSGLLYCADCNSKLSHRVSIVQKKYPDDSYVCSNYRQLTRDCTMHYIATKNMEKLILSTIQRVSWYVKENEQEFIGKVREASSVQQEETVKACKQKLRQSEKRYAELDVLVKKLYESNATGKLSDRHFERLMAEYDEEQKTLETTIKELQNQVDTWSEDKLKTDRFIELVKRYTDFSELTTPMLNEFVEKVIVYDGIGRGKARRQRVDIHLNFIGNFELPADFVTPMEIEQQRRQEEEQAVKQQRSKELAKIQAEKIQKRNRGFTARKRAGLLTPEEIEADKIRMEIKRVKHKEWREKRRAEEPPKPKKVSRNDVIKRKSAGLPLTPEEFEIYEVWKNKRTEQHRIRRHLKKANEPPKPPKEKKPTKKEIIADIILRKNEGLPLTPEETETYNLYREDRNTKNKIWRDAKAEQNPKPPKLFMTDITKRRQEGLPLTPEEEEAYALWREHRREYQREWREKNSGYYRDYKRNRKAENVQAVGL